MNVVFQSVISMERLVICKYNPHYLVSSEGYIISKKRKNAVPLKGRLSANGYLRVYIRVDGKRKDFFIHRLVAEHFLPNPNSFTDVNHIDGDKTNNKVTNLEWCTHSHNVKHAFSKGLNAPVYKPCVIEGIYYASQTEASQKLGVCRHTIDNWIKEGKGYYVCD